MIWFTSDLHLGHAGVIEYCNRPFADVATMDECLRERWNKAVTPGDLVYVLGDVSFHKAATGKPLLYSLYGRKILIRGNHDKWSDKQYRDCGFDTILEEARIRLGGWQVKLSHYPYFEDLPASDPAYEARYPDRRPKNDGGWLLCGHVHKKWKTRGRMINVGVDQWGFAPVSVNAIESLIARGTQKEKST